MTDRRRFPPPWTPSELDNASAFVVTDGTGQRLAYVYFEEEPGRQRAAELLTRDEARRIAANIAKIPDMLTKRTDGLREAIAALEREADNSGLDQVALLLEMAKEAIRDS